MSARRTMVRWLVCASVALPTYSVGQTLEAAAGTHFGRVPAAHTGTVVLRTLSVKPLGVDLPWDPRVCIGCDRNNEAAGERVHRRRLR